MHGAVIISTLVCVLCLPLTSLHPSARFLCMVMWDSGVHGALILVCVLCLPLPSLHLFVFFILHVYIVLKINNMSQVLILDVYNVLRYFWPIEKASP